MNFLAQYFARAEIVKLVYTFLFAGIAYLVLRYFILHTFPRFAKRSVILSEPEKSVRISTVQGILLTLIKIFFGFIVLFSLLEAFGVDIKGLLISAGILGLAISFGSQSLVKDLVNGFFILAEGQINIGDPIEIDDIKGLISGITLRYVQLVDPKGKIVYIPFGQINKVKNLRSVATLSALEGLPENSREGFAAAKTVVEVEKEIFQRTKKTKLLVYSSIFIDDPSVLMFLLQGINAEKEAQSLLSWLRSISLSALLVKVKDEASVLTIFLKKDAVPPGGND